MFNDGFRLRVLAGNVASEDGQLIFAIGILDIEDPWDMAGLDEVEGCGWDGRCQNAEWILLYKLAKSGNGVLCVNGAKIHYGQFETLEMSYQMDSTEMCTGTLKLYGGCKESDKLRGDSLVDRMRMPNWEVL